MCCIIVFVRVLAPVSGPGGDMVTGNNGGTRGGGHNTHNDTEQSANIPDRAGSTNDFLKQMNMISSRLWVNGTENNSIGYRPRR